MEPSRVGSLPVRLIVKAPQDQFVGLDFAGGRFAHRIEAPEMRIACRVAEQRRGGLRRAGQQRFMDRTLDLSDRHVPSGGRTGIDLACRPIRLLDAIDERAVILGILRLRDAQFRKGRDGRTRERPDNLLVGS